MPGIMLPLPASISNHNSILNSIPSGPLSEFLVERVAAGIPRRKSYHPDHNKGIIFGVKLAQSQSRNRGTEMTPVNLPRRYSESILEKFVGNKNKPGLYDGIPVQQGHDPVPPEERIGAVYNPRFEVHLGERIIIGDWHLNTKHRLFEQFMEDAEKFPDNLALSHEIFDWKQTLQEDHVLITDTDKVEWFSLVTDGGLNTSLVESHQRQDNPVSPYVSLVHAILGKKGTPMSFRLNENTTAQEFISHYPQVAARIVEACQCGGSGSASCGTENTPILTAPAQTPLPTFDRALSSRIEQLAEDNEKLRKQIEKTELQKQLQEHFELLSKDIDSSLVETARPTAAQLTSWMELGSETAKAMMAQHVATIQATAAKVQESFVNNGHHHSSLVERVQYGAGAIPQGNPQGSRPDFSAYKGGFQRPEGINPAANRLARLLS